LEHQHDTLSRHRLAVVGNGRIGSLVSAALGLPTPFGRGFDGSAPAVAEQGYDAVLLCVPDAEIPVAAAAIRPGILVGHCSGASGLDVLGGHEGFSVHPLMTVTRSGADLTGASAAIDGTSERALAYAKALARGLRMAPFRLAPEDRAAYHAAASIASNFLVTLEAAAEQLAATSGVDRQMLAPLVRATVENWAELGSGSALTGPVARGDAATVTVQREAVAERAPDLLELFDTMVRATERLAEPERLAEHSHSAATPSEASTR
jgi:predicted short-subunit dehydrogenase-like oxidoreductase (DUF2520 family)